MTPMHEMRQQAAEKDSYASLRSFAGQPQGVPLQCVVFTGVPGLIVGVGPCAYPRSSIHRAPCL